MMGLGPLTRPVTEFPNPGAVRRLTKELEKMQKEPTDGIWAVPNESNILEWDFCLRGSHDTAFEGGYYHGKLYFRPNFPFSPPSIMMITPNGRFVPSRPICLSISDFHPESWNPGWTIISMLVGLLSFMNENNMTHGYVATSYSEKRQLAAASLKFNLRDKRFVAQFPTVVEEMKKKLDRKRSRNLESSDGASSSKKLKTDSSASGEGTEDDPVTLDD